MSPPSNASAVIGPGPTVRSPPPVIDTLPPSPPCLPPLASIAALTVTAPVPRTSHATQPDPSPPILSILQPDLSRRLRLHPMTGTVD